MRRFCKKLFNSIFDKEMWISSFIEIVGWTLFWVVGGYIAFFTKTNPWWFKLIYIGLLAITLYALCVTIDYLVQKK